MWGQPFPVSVISVGGNLSHEVERFSRDYDFIAIDCPPTLETEQSRKAMLAANTILIRVLPSPLDLWASVRLAETIEQIKQLRRECNGIRATHSAGDCTMRSDSRDTTFYCETLLARLNKRRLSIPVQSGSRWWVFPHGLFISLGYSSLYSSAPIG